MPMYNILFGCNPHAKLLLKLLNLTENDIGRFRDAFVTEGKIAIYTRLGGGNRECWCQGDKHSCYQANIRKLQSHLNYISDKDDDFDRTYATFYFSFPEDYREILERMDSGKFNPDKRWQEKIKEVQEMPADEIRAKFPEIVAALDEISQAIEKGESGKVIEI